VFAWEFKERDIGKVVGEKTAGAVIPATFVPVGEDMVLMFPSFRLPKYTNILEGIGVTPDVAVRDDIPYAQGADPILEAGIKTLLNAPSR
jgi:C-terminal processing protease CtpA/Prc